MKKIYSFLAAAAVVCTSNISNAQSIDVGVGSITTLTDGEAIIPGFEQRAVAFTITNFAQTAVATSDFGITFNFNGTDSNQINLQGNPINAGATVNVNPVAVDMSGRLQQGNNRFCVYTHPRGSATDTDHSNDSTCINLTYDLAAGVPDIAATSVAITMPSNANNRYPIGTIMSEMQAVFTNNSTTTIPAGNRINYTISIDLATQDLVGTLQSNWAPGATTTRTITANLPALPQVVGTYKMCAYSRIADNNSANDTVCVDVEIFDPAASIDELTSTNKIKAFYNQEQVVVDLTLGNASDVQVLLHNVAGQQIAQKNTRVFGGAEERVVLPTQNLSAGVYVVSVMAEGQLVESTKLVVR